MLNNSRKFSGISSPSAHIHLKEGSTSKTEHNPIPVPYHYIKEVRKALWEDIKRGIITPILIGAAPWTLPWRKMGNRRGQKTISIWIPNANGKTYHISSPFQLSLQVPPNTKKQSWMPWMATTQSPQIRNHNHLQLMLRSHIHEYGHVRNKHVMFITIEYIKNRNLKNT